eukprot:SAG11_NODE_3865_length_2182_cov_1.506961_2_plen_114_part_00
MDFRFDATAVTTEDATVHTLICTLTQVRKPWQTYDKMKNEKKMIEAADKVALVNLLSGCGFRRIEVASFVSPKWVPQMAVRHGSRHCMHIVDRKHHRGLPLPHFCSCAVQLRH